MSGPWTFDEARDKCIAASKAQEAAEDSLKTAARVYAAAEEVYRKGLAVKIVELHESGAAWSSTSDLARGDETVAEMKRHRDISQGVLEAHKHIAWRRNADRKDAQRFADWSQRREFAEHGSGGPGPEPEFEAPIGG